MEIISGRMHFTTQYKGATNHRGARVVVFCPRLNKRLSVPWNHELSTPNNHGYAIIAFCKKHFKGFGDERVVLSETFNGKGYIGWIA